ncbi:MAG: RNA polymerase subunit sigma-70 [Sphingobacteriales bacterium 50-39]|nr:RNA polymerase sigma factor [Sphingobacteriales bacterium]OJW58428.1 MAG: RNA polymerase subunit sigma-70 [Sphingobacteriales bacterium 50-39]
MTSQEQEHIFRDWLEQYKGLFFKIVRTYTVTAMDMDDLFQEIVIQVWRSIPVWKKNCAVSTWIYRIAINTALSWTRKEKRRRQTEDLETAQVLLMEPVLVADERLAWLYEEIHQMDVIDRSMALLLLEGFSYKEMAVIMGITESNVGVKINRIKKKLIVRSQKQDLYGI